ncbi:MAG: hypothetical protein WCT04_14150 [Planctomycetota bacterium]
MTTTESLKSARTAAFFAFLFHALGLVVALFGIRFGTAVFTPEQRMAFVATSPWGWKAAWGVWLIAAVTFVWFLARVEKTWDASGGTARLSLIIGVVAASLDIVFDTLQIVVLPAVAARGPEARQVFLALAHFASSGGIVVANGLYAVSVALMTHAIRAQLSKVQLWCGWSVLAAGLLLTAAGFFEDPHLPEIFAGPAIGTYMLWVAALAWFGPSSAKP